MKKILLLITALTSVYSAKSQSFLGYATDNYAGVQSVLFNPATIVDSNFKTDINLFSVSLVGANDFYGVNVSKLMNGSYDLGTDAKQFSATSNNFIINADIMGPSFMFNIAPKHSIAIFTRSRVIANINNINGELFDQLSNDFDTDKSFNLNAGKLNITASSWAEVGFSYATVLLNKQEHFLKGGISIKYLQGIANSYVNADNASVDYRYNGPDPRFNNLMTSGVLTYGGSQDFEKNSDSFQIDSNSKGMGADLGFVYEFRPESTNKYLFKTGFSITDIGSIDYTQGTQKKYNLNKTLTEAQYQNAESIKDLLDQNYLVTDNGTAVKSYLPTAMHLNVDWNFYGKMYLNMNGDFNLNDKSALNKSVIANVFSLTPRYETKWFTAYLPLSYMDYRGMQAGFGFRLGPLFLGSSSAITNLISQESKGFDIHMGLKIPVYRKAKRL